MVFILFFLIFVSRWQSLHVCGNSCLCPPRGSQFLSSNFWVGTKLFSNVDGFYVAETILYLMRVFCVCRLIFSLVHYFVNQDYVWHFSCQVCACTEFLYCFCSKPVPHIITFFFFLLLLSIYYSEMTSGHLDAHYTKCFLGLPRLKMQVNGLYSKEL